MNMLEKQAFRFVDDSYLFKRKFLIATDKKDDGSKQKDFQVEP